MLNLKVIGSNMTEVVTNRGKVLFSYNTPVAAEIDGKLVKTAKKWSQTTSRHINKWLAGANAEEVPQEYLDKLL